jgi:hypothetical protein
MGTVRFATVVLMIIAAPVFSASTVSYEIQLGGNNHADSIKACIQTCTVAACPRMTMAYTQGSAADNQTFYRTDPLNWAATIAVSGNQDQPGHPSDGLPTKGVANFVLNLELHQGTVDGEIMSNVAYYSTIHDGTVGEGQYCANGTNCTQLNLLAAGGYALPCPTPTCTSFCAGAAFAYVFDINNVHWGYGNVLEAQSNGTGGHFTGPFMEVGMYPTVDLGNTRGDGQLLGVGAGYGRWNRASGQLSSRTTKGVGLVNNGSNGGLGIHPVVEGQIDVSQLAVGTYVLKLNPGTGHNVLRGDANLETDVQTQAFAVPANQTAGDTITFILADPPPALVLMSVKAMRTHGTAEIGVPFFPDTPDTNAVECRSGPVTKVVATFDQTIYCAGGSCDPTDVTFTKLNDPNSSVTGVSANGSDLTITISNQDTYPDRLTLAFPGIWDSFQRTKVSDIACLRVITGDVDSSGTTTQLDLVRVRGKMGLPVADTNFRNDVTVDGAIDGADLTAVRDRLLMTIGACP